MFFCMNSWIDVVWLSIRKSAALVRMAKVIACRWQWEDGLIFFVFAPATRINSFTFLLFFTLMMIYHFPLEIISLIFVLGAFHFLFYQFCLDIQQCSVLYWQIFVLFHNFGHFILEILVYFIEVVEFFQQNKVLFIFFLQLFP